MWACCRQLFPAQKQARDDSAVTTRPSRLWCGGTGLFATRAVPAKSFLCRFGGVDVDTLEGSSRTHVVELLKGRLWRDGDPERFFADDGPVWHPGFGQYANRATGGVLKHTECADGGKQKKVRSNAKIVVRRRRDTGQLEPYLVTTRPVAAGDEIYVPYGRSYRMAPLPPQPPPPPPKSDATSFSDV
jgi:hypothetical protein